LENVFEAALLDAMSSLQDVGVATPRSTVDIPCIFLTVREYRHPNHHQVTVNEVNSRQVEQAKQSKSNQSNAKQRKATQSNAKQRKATQSNAKQRKATQSKAK